MKRAKITIVGAGNVGATTAHTIVIYARFIDSSPAKKCFLNALRMLGRRRKMSHFAEQRQVDWRKSLVMNNGVASWPRNRCRLD